MKHTVENKIQVNVKFPLGYCPDPFYYLIYWTTGSRQRTRVHSASKRSEITLRLEPGFEFQFQGEIICYGIVEKIVTVTKSGGGLTRFTWESNPQFIVYQRIIPYPRKDAQNVVITKFENVKISS